VLASPVTAQAALLQALISEPGYGLELIDRVAERTGGRVKLHQGSIYPALRAMVREGLIETYEADPLPSRGGRPRTYYKITAEGRKVARSDSKVFAVFGALAGAT
jgi:PadR family transcriptional regulator PadR